MRRSALVLGVLLGVAGASPAAAVAVEPIEGTWHYSGGVVLVESAGPSSFRGVVVRTTRFGSCAHPAGERMWTVSGTGAAYSGTHQWFSEGECAPQPGGLASWAVREDGERYVLRFCTAPPDAGAPDPAKAETVCSDLERARPSSRPAPRACVGSACLNAPEELLRLGCLPRRPFSYRFPFALRGRDRRRLTVLQARFALDWKGNGVDRRTPFVARVDGRRITPGPHLLRADVRLRVRGTRRSVHRRMNYRFLGCS